MNLLKSLKLLLVVSFVIGVAKSNAQTAAQNKANSSAAPTEARAANVVKPPVAAKRKSIAPVASAENMSGENHSVINENDPYMGRSQEILERLTVKEIPADFPKYQAGYGVKYYNDLLDGYYMAHPAIVQKWVTDKLNQKKN